MDKEKEIVNLTITGVSEKTVKAVTSYKYYISNRPDSNTTIINFVTNEDKKNFLFEQYWERFNKK